MNVNVFAKRALVILIVFFVGGAAPAMARPRPTELRSATQHRVLLAGNELCATERARRARDHATALTQLKRLQDAGAKDDATKKQVAELTGKIKEFEKPPAPLAAGEIATIDALPHRALGACKKDAASADCRNALASTCPSDSASLPAPPAAPAPPAPSPIRADRLIELAPDLPNGGTTMPLPGGVSWQTAAATGLAQFLQQRSQQEVVLWLEEDVLKSLCSDKVPWGTQVIAGSDLLPRTCDLQKNDSQHLGSTFSAALRADLEALPPTLLAVLLDVDRKVVVELLATLQQLRTGAPPLQTIAGWANDDVFKGFCAPAPPPATQPSGPTKELACGLIGIGYAASWAADVQVEPATFARTRSVATESFADEIYKACVAELKDACPLRQFTTAEAQPFVDDLHAIYALVKSWQGASSQGAADLAARGGMLLNRVLDAIDDGAVLLDPKKAPFFQKVNDGKAHWVEIEPAFRASAEILQGQIAEGVRDGFAAAWALSKEADNVPPALVQTLALCADLAAAKDANEVQAALETNTAPLGTWRGKGTGGMVAIGAFVGGGIGYELPVDKKTGSTFAGSAAGGAMAALGIDLTLPYPGRKNCGSFGLFLSVIDVGQLLSSPIAPQPSDGKSPDSTRATAGGDLKLTQVLSPGAYAHFSLGPSPFTVGTGMSLAPELREYKSVAGGTQAQVAMLRFNAFLAVDVTLLPVLRVHGTASDKTNPGKAALNTK